MKKNKTKSILACAVLAGVLGSGFGMGMSMAEAADFTYSIDGATAVVWDGTYDLKLNEKSSTGTKLEIWGDGASTSNKVYGGYYYDGATGVSGKEVDFYSGTVDSLYGGYSKYGKATNNTVKLAGGIVSYNIFGCYAIETEEASKNTVIVSSGSAMYIHGGYGDLGNVTENTVTVSGGSVMWIFGGYGNRITEREVSKNIVNIDGGTVKFVIGGISDISGNVTANKVTITNGTFENDNQIYGGESKNSGEVAENTVTISGGTFGSNTTVYGGHSGSGVSEQNTVTISGGTFGSNTTVYGGYSTNNVTENTITISDATFGNNTKIQGGYSENGNVTGNNVTIENITFTGKVDFHCGGYSKNGSALNNILTITDSSFDSSNNSFIYGGSSNTLAKGNKVHLTNVNFRYAIYGGYALNTEGNEVTVSGGTISGVDFIESQSGIFGGYDKGSGNSTAKDNAVTISDGNVIGKIVGGCATNVINNKVTINGGTFGGTAGIFSGIAVYGGIAMNELFEREMTGNTVTITGGNFESSAMICGVYFRPAGGVSGDQRILENKVIISGGTFGGNTKIYGVYSEKWTYNATGNIITISGGTFGDGTVIYVCYSNFQSSEVSGNKVIVSGGDLSRAEVYGHNYTGNDYKNNALQIENTTAIKKIGGFENIDFLLPAGIANNATMLTLANAVNLNGVAVNVYLNGQEPDNITLIDKVENSGSYNVYTGTIGSTELADNYIISLESGNLLLKVKEVLWYTVGAEAKKFVPNASVQSISGVTDDVTIYRGTTYDSETKTGNEYASIDATGHKVTIDSENPITVTGDLTAAAVVINSERTLIMDSGKKLTANGVDNSGTLNIGAGDLLSDVTNSGTVNLGEGTLASGNTITSGILNINGDVIANANDIAGNANTVASGKTLTFNGGAMTHKVTGEGTLKFTSDMEINADNAATATSVVDNGVTLTVNGGTFDKKLGGAGTLKVTGTLHYGTNAELVAVGTQTVGDKNIPVSNVNVTIADGGVMDMRDRESTTGGCINALTFSGGALDFSGGYVGNLLIAKTLDASAGDGGYISFDVSATGNDKIGVLTSVAGGSKLTLDTINVQGELVGDVAPAGGVSGSITFALDLTGGSALDNLTISGNVTYNGHIVAVALAGNYLYSFWQDATDKGKLNYYKEIGAGIRQVVQAKDYDGTYSAIYGSIDTYCFTEQDGQNLKPYTETKLNEIKALYGETSDFYTTAKDLNESYGDLGTLTRVEGATSRTLTIQGNGRPLSGGTYNGITINSGDTLVLKNISTVTDAANNKIATNNGTVLLSGSGTMAVKASVDGTGKLIVDGVDAVLGENYRYITGRTALTADELASLKLKVEGGTATEIETKEYNFGWKLNSDGSYVTTLSEVTSAVITQNDLEIRSGSLTANADNLHIANSIVNNSELKFIGGTLSKMVTGTGNLTFDGDVMTNADNIATEGTNTVADGKTLTFDGGTLTKKVQGAGDLTFAADMTLNADNIATEGTNTVASGKTLTFNAGTLAKKIEGAGNLKFTDNVSTNADNIATEGTNEVTSSAKLAFAGGTLTKDITGDGTAEFNGTVCVADGVQLGATTNNVNGTLDVPEHITASNINFQNGSTLKVDGTKITDTAAITGITGATVASGSKLYVSNAVKDTAYKILDGSGINVSSWTTDGDMGDEFKASYGLIVDTDNTTTAGTGLSEFHIQFKEDTAATGSSDIGNIIANLSAGSEAKAWIDNISASQPDVQTQGNTVNTMANIGSLANVQGGMNAMSSFTSNSIASNIGSESRPMLGNRGQVSGVRNVSANGKDSNAKVEVIEQGRASEVMPTQYEEQKYGKEVWASFIHSKTKIEGMKTGHLEQNSTLQYNGTVVGVDLWSGRHGFGGVALTYGNGNFHSDQMVSKVKNDADYYGISVYNRQDVGKFSFQYDAGFTYAKNDVTMSTMGAEDVTAKPKVRAYSAGIKVEEPIKVGRATEVVPFAGARYTFVKSKEYQNSLGLGYDVDNQHLVKIPVGMSLRTKYLDKSGWKLGTTLSGGYSWNLCNRSSQQRVSFGGYSDMIDFDIADRGEYFINAAVQAEYENLLFELGYNYSKGKTTRSNKWYVSANLGF